MPTIPAAPPPPISTSSRSYIRTNSTEFKKEHQFCSEALWAVGDPSIQKACFFARICLKNSPKVCMYIKVKSTLQVGPTCGLVVVSMILGGLPTAGDLLKQAKTLGYSKNGEMFSAKYLCDILKQNLTQTHKPNEIRAYLYLGNLNCEFIKAKLESKAMLLVPYDADRNHSPCNRNGSKAHWALILGYLIDEDDSTYVISRHGKTKNLGVWNLEKLSESNSNLNEFVQPAWHQDEEFLFYPEGKDQNENLINGLKNSCIIVEGIKNEVVKIL